MQIIEGGVCVATKFSLRVQIYHIRRKNTLDELLILKI